VQLLERENALGELGAAYARTVASGQIALVGAEAGLGKTSLLRGFADRHPDVRVLWGACDALFTPRPLAPLLDVARQAGGPLAGAVRDGAARDRLFAAALDEFEARRAAVVFEDLHWADEATLDFLTFLGRRIARTRTMLVLTYRDDEVGPAHPLHQVLADLPRGHVHRIPLAPLSAGAVAGLARAAGRPPADLHRVTAGNPLFVTEVLAGDGEQVPATVREAALARAGRLAPGARALAEIAAVVPTAAEPWLLSALAPHSPDDLDGCLAIGMTLRADGALAWRHELVRRAVEASLPPGRRRELHARVLGALAARPDVSPARLAHHAAGAEDAAAVLVHAQAAAAQAVTVGAHREAAQHLEAALRHGTSLPPPALAGLHEQLSYEYYLTDRTELALGERRAALGLWTALGDTVRRGASLRWLSRLSWFVGDRGGAERYADEAIAVLESVPVGRELGLAYSNRAQLDMLATANDDAVAWADRAIAIGERLSDLEIRAHALNNRGTALLNDDREAGRADLERSLALSLEANLHEHAARAYTNLVSTTVTARRYADANRYLAAGLAYAEQRDLDSWRLYMQAYRARARLERGDWLGAGDDAESILAHPRVSTVTRLPTLIVLGTLRARRGDPDAGGPFDEARALAARVQEIQRTGPLVAALGELAFLDGAPARAQADVLEAYGLAGAQRDRWARGAVGIWGWRAGWLEALDACAEPYALEAAGRWQEAATLWERLGCPYDRAWTLGWNGDAEACRTAFELLESLGAGAAVTALRRHLKARGVRGVPRGARPSTRSHPQGLTRREVEVLELMCAGLRNAAIAERLHLSTRTVDHHVSAVLAKLGAESRAEAIARAARLTAD
jgi:DNA-binding CsgD family transcriptional regulator/tetratricopeptide (TPR) repeat protein